MATREEEKTVIVKEEVDDEHDAKEAVLQRYFLQEWKLVKTLMDDIVSNGRVVDPSSVQKIRSIMDKYQEQGQLVEPYLESIVSPLMLIIRSKTVGLGLESDEILEIIKPISIIIYSLVTVCGYKAVMKFFPHQVSDLELAVSLLEKFHKTASGTSLRQESTGEMEAKCVILLWLAILVLIPFDISSVDTSMASNSSIGKGEIAPLVLRILGFCKDYICSAGPMRSISGLVLSRLLTRPDMPKAFTSFVEWTHGVLSSHADDVMSHFRLLGVMEAIGAIFKTGSRNLLLEVATSVWNDVTILSKSVTASRSPLLRKYLIKVTQRIGLICLPHRSPSWRYVSKTTAFHKNMATSEKVYQSDPVVSVESSNIQEDEDMEIQDIVEEIMEFLLSGLRDTDTVVRWSAAKGIGRVTSRLTSILAEEVLSSVLELFSPGEGDGSWHGGCLALAELARRGLLLPRSFPKVVPVIVKALHYDVRRGPHSVGSHVRDAAAYVCWAFGRAYYHTDMKNVLEQIAPHLLTVACYDREVNCRRAAAAAFQENVGRQGNFSHGIDIVNIADYFSLSSRANSFLQVAVSIAQYEGYLYAFVDDLLNNKICHWDRGLRELAAEALAALVKNDPEHFENYVLEKLIPCTLSSDLCMRHGATLTVGEVVLALHQSANILPAEKQKRVANIVPAIEKARLYRGKGGEIMRSAVSRFIECISSSQVTLSEKIKRSLLDTLNENLRHPNSLIQNAAVRSIKQYVRAYLVNTDGGADVAIISKHLAQLTDQNVASRRGSALALGAFPYELLIKRWKDVVLKLCSSCQIEENSEERDAEARVNAVKGLTFVCETLTQHREDSDISRVNDEASLFLLIKNEVMSCLLKALDDYSVDNRGDVGSWVREAALDGLEKCTYILCEKDAMSSSSDHSIPSPLFDSNLATNLVGGIVKQVMEKMDKLREAAAKVLQRILYHKTIFVSVIPYREKLVEIVPKETYSKWAVPSFSYPRFVQLLEFSCYSKAVLSGLVISTGGLQESLRKASLSALLDYLQKGDARDFDGEKFRVRMLCSDVLWILEEYKKCDRVIVPCLKTVEILFGSQIFLNTEDHILRFYEGLLDALTIELRGSKDFSKLYAAIAILGYIASVSDSINIKAFSQLLAFLSHRYPKIRKAAADQVYLVILQNGNLLAETKIDKALEIISETCWEGELESTKAQTIELLELAGLDPAMVLKASKRAVRHKDAAERKTAASDENASYSALVDSTGF